MMKDDDFKLLRGFDNRQTDEGTDICDCRVAFATEKYFWAKEVTPTLMMTDLLVQCVKLSSCSGPL